AASRGGARGLSPAKLAPRGGSPPVIPPTALGKPGGPLRRARASGVVGGRTRFGAPTGRPIPRACKSGHRGDRDGPRRPGRAGGAASRLATTKRSRNRCTREPCEVVRPAGRNRWGRRRGQRA